MTRVMRQDVDAALPYGWPHCASPATPLVPIAVTDARLAEAIERRRQLEAQLADVNAAIEAAQ